GCVSRGKPPDCFARLSAITSNLCSARPRLRNRERAADARIRGLTPRGSLVQVASREIPHVAHPVAFTESFQAEDRAWPIKLTQSALSSFPSFPAQQGAGPDSAGLPSALRCPCQVSMRRTLSFVECGGLSSAPLRALRRPLSGLSVCVLLLLCGG